MKESMEGEYCTKYGIDYLLIDFRSSLLPPPLPAIFSGGPNMDRHASPLSDACETASRAL